MSRITIRHVGGNTLSGTVEQVLSTHLAPGWSLVGNEAHTTPLTTGYPVYPASPGLHEGPYGYGSQDR